MDGVIRKKFILLKEDPPHWAGPEYLLMTRPLPCGSKSFGTPPNVTVYMFFTVVCGARDGTRASCVCLASTLSPAELQSQPCVLLRCPTVVQILSVLCSLQNSRHSGMFKQHNEEESRAHRVSLGIAVSHQNVMSVYLREYF